MPIHLTTEKKWPNSLKSQTITAHMGRKRCPILIREIDFGAENLPQRKRWAQMFLLMNFTLCKEKLIPIL